MQPIVPMQGPAISESKLKVGQVYDVYISFRTSRGMVTEFQGRGKYAGKDGSETWLFKSFIKPDGMPSQNAVERIVTTNPVFKAGPKTPKIPVVAPKTIPAGSEDPITREDIKNGDAMIDFDNEASFSRYYHETTYPLLRNKNPFTNKEINISTVQKYTANVAAGGKRRKTRKMKMSTRKTHKRK